MRPRSAPPVVGIGGSAGSVDALQKFFATVPADLGVAFVVIVHLAPDRDSELPQILARKTEMPVVQVGDHDSVKLAANHVYVIAPDRKLEITDSSVGASRFEQPYGQRTAIDLFFRSLAAGHGDGFAIVLSGGGSDGTLGAKAIKEAGGLVLVQSPSDAAHDAMPKAVIATGIADVVAPVEELARRLSALARSKDEVAAMLQASLQESSMEHATERSLKAVLEILRQRTGHDFSKYKRSTVLRRLTRRMQLNHQTTFSDYRDYLKENVEEIQALFDDLLISVTMFFRDPEAWDALQAQVLGALVEQADPDEPIRAWVPGCATGEEAYTLAILLQEEISRRRVQRDFIVFASDVDEGALASAREGIYPSGISTSLSEERLNRHFSLHDGHYRVSRDLRDHVVFAPHSLLRDPPFSRLHLISCRNLLIYLNRELQEQVMALFHYACQSSAYLFLGVSEQADHETFRVIDKKNRIFQVVKSESSRASLPALLATPRGPTPQEREPRTATQSPAAEVHLEALEAAAPPSLVIDERWNIVHLSNRASRYLQQRGGPFARHITDVVRPDLRDAVHIVLSRVFEQAEAQVSPFVAVQFNGTPQRVAVHAQRHQKGDKEHTYALLTFLEAGAVEAEEAPNDEDANDTGVRHELREKLRQAELRIESMRDDRHLATEDLRAANEELQSLNEEYRSTTEELETSKEELQSVNEELQTVNHELKTKLEEISRAHDDLENLMAATNIPTLFLSTDLRINRFTPQFGEVFSVTARDHGRPIGNFTHRLDYDTLEADAHAVLTQSTPIEREVQARDGRTFILRLAPYRTSEAKVEGIVVTLVDVTELLKAETESRENAAQFRALVDASAQMVWTADPAGRHIEDSPSWRSFTGQSFDQWMSSWLEAVHPNDQQLAADGWKQAVETQSTFASEFRVFNAATQTYRWTTVRAVPLQAADGTIRGWVGMHTDVTERRQAEEALREADRRKDEFLAILGHELRNPLAAIRNSVAAHELTVTDGEDPDRSWAIMDRQSQHMTRLVNDLLDIVRLERGKLQLQPEPIDLLDCVREVAQGIQGSCRTARLTLNVELPDEPLHVQADPERMIQVLDNLLRNAVSYTGPGGEITIVARRQGKRATVCIRDTGIGMEPSEIDQLFEPYHQINPGRRSGGLGLGLTLVKRLMELHGGTVSARSDGVGNGSEFEIGLTLAATESQKSASATLQKPPRRRVLVVDDEPDVASTFASLLEALDQEVIVVNTGKAGLDAAHEHSPEIVFLDLSMPVMDGRAVARQLRENGAQDLYIVALSGFGRDKQLSRDFDDHLLKPATADTLIGLLTSFDRAP